MATAVSEREVLPVTGAGHSSRATVVWLSLAVVACKCLALLADPHPSFHFGDSGAYLATALAKWIPPDRSFTYGFLIRPLVLKTHSLLPVLVCQTALSAGACIVLGVLLLRYFRATPAIAFTFAILCAVEPLQLMSERFIMTETVATFAFCLFVWATCYYLRSTQISSLVLVQALGVLLVSLRYSFLPLTVVAAFVLPLLTRFRRSCPHPPRLALHLALAILSSQALLLGYRHLYGWLAHCEPSYLSRDGEFLAADMAPLIRPADFPVVSGRAEVFRKVTIPLDNIDNRRLHRWVPGGLCEAILEFAKRNEDLANSLARRTALRAVRRRPFGVVRLAYGTYRQFLTQRKVSWALKLDAGHFVEPTANDVQMIGRWFHIDPRDRKFNSVTKKWEGVAGLWCGLIVLLPWLYLSELVVHRREATAADILLLLSALLSLASAIVPVEIANPRYLIPLPWLSVLILGVVCTRTSQLRNHQVLSLAPTLPAL